MKFFAALCIITTMTAQSAADDIQTPDLMSAVFGTAGMVLQDATSDIPTISQSSNDVINSVFGFAHSDRGRAAMQSKYIALNTYAIAFIYSEHPTFTTGDRLQNILSQIMSAEAPILPDKGIQLKEQYANFEQKAQQAILKNIPAEELPIKMQDGDSDMYICGLYDIILTERWLHVSREVLIKNNGACSTCGTSGLHQLRTKIFPTDHHLCDGSCFSSSDRRLKGTNAQTSAKILQSRHPEKPFHAIIDNATWEFLCNEHRKPLSQEEQEAEAALKDLAVRVSFGLEH
jgi:hypothetical protein